MQNNKEDILKEIGCYFDDGSNNVVDTHKQNINDTVETVEIQSKNPNNMDKIVEKPERNKYIYDYNLANEEVQDALFELSKMEISDNQLSKIGVLDIDKFNLVSIKSLFESDKSKSFGFDDYYYCTKKIKVKTSKVLNAVKELFVRYNTDVLDLNCIYQYLQLQLSINSINRKNLLALLRSEDIYIYLSDFTKLYSEFIAYEKSKSQELIQSIRNIVDHIHPHNVNFPIKSLVNQSVCEFLEGMNITYVGQLKLMSDEDIEHCILLGKEGVINFIKSLQNSFPNYISELFCNKVIKMQNKLGHDSSNWPKYLNLISARISGSTLDAAGKIYGITRERVRQLEAKYKKLFESFYYSIQGGAGEYLRIFSSNPFYMNCDEINKVINVYGNVFIYLLKNTATEDLMYVEEINSFIFKDNFDWYGYLLNSSEDIPDIISIDKKAIIVSKFVNDLHENEVDIPAQIVEKILLKDYQLLGNVYSKEKITLTDKYLYILKKHFSNGIYIYKKEDIDKLREFYKKIYNDNKLPGNDRAIANAIERKTVLCDKGKYKLKQDKYISEDLAHDIEDYIDKSSHEIFLTNTIFAVFRKRLENESVRNKYYLQGILHEIYGNKYIFHRDYISKSNDLTSIYSSIANYIKYAGRPVLKIELQQLIPGVPDIVLSFALGTDEIVIGQGVYIHKNCLYAHEDMLNLIKVFIDKLVSDEEIHNSEELYNEIKDNNPEIIETFGINNRYTLFSILEYIYENDYSFNRPFIAKKGVEVLDSIEIVRNIVREHDETSFSEVMKFVYDNRLKNAGYLSTLEWLGDEFLMRNKDTLIKKECVFNDEYDLECLDSGIKTIIGFEEFIVLDSNTDYSKLPDLKIPWTEWLVYGLVNRYSDDYNVIPSDAKLAVAKPIIIKKILGIKNIDDLKNYEKYIKQLSDSEIDQLFIQKGVIE